MKKHSNVKITVSILFFVLMVNILAFAVPVFGDDTTPPVTTVEYSDGINGVWHPDDFTVYLYGSDEEGG